MSVMSFKKKAIFSKSQKVFPPLIPIQPIARVKSSPSLFKKKEAIITEEPQLIFTQCITKPSNMCPNANCQNMDISDKDLGLGYCSTKCVVEHSAFLFNEWVFKRNYKEKPIIPTETEMNVSNDCPKAPNLVIVNDVIDCHENVIPTSPREPLFNILFNQYCNDSMVNSNQNDSPIYQSHASAANGHKTNNSRESSPEVTFIEHPIQMNRKRKLNRPEHAQRLMRMAEQKNSEMITIVID